MTQRNKVKISGDLKSYRPKSKYHKPIMEGYGFQNGDFVFSDDIRVWSQGKTRRKKHYKNLF